MDEPDATHVAGWTVGWMMGKKRVEMTITVEQGLVVVRPGELGHFTQWEERTLMANGFQREAEQFTAHDDKDGTAMYAARMVKQGGCG